MSSYVKYKVVIKDFKILDIEDEIIHNEKIHYSKECIIEGEKVNLIVSLQEIKEKDNIFILQVTSDKNLYEQKLMPVAKEATYNLLNKIAFHFESAKVGEPWIIARDFEDKKMGTAEITGSVYINTEDRDKKLLENLCSEIKGSIDFTWNIYNLFRTAMNNEDVVVKYMFLYQILLFKHLNSKGNESQQAVDDFIKSKFIADKHMFQKWGDSGYEETIYTRLRNQVGHCRNKTSQETRNTMSTKISELIELVKLSI